MVKLANSKATEVCRVYLVLQLQSAMVLLGCFVAQTRGVMFTRAGDNVLVVREPCNLFDPSCVKVGLRGQVCIYILGGIRGQSRVYYKSVRDSAQKSSEMQCIFCVLCNYYVIFVTSQ